MSIRIIAKSLFIFVLLVIVLFVLFRLADYTLLELTGNYQLVFSTDQLLKLSLFVGIGGTVLAICDHKIRR